MKIIAFSDYRVHSIDLLYKLFERVGSTDFVVYGGDDLNRFSTLPEAVVDRVFKYYFYRKRHPRVNKVDILSVPVLREEERALLGNNSYRIRSYVLNGFVYDIVDFSDNLSSILSKIIWS